MALMELSARGAAPEDQSARPSAGVLEDCLGTEDKRYGYEYTYGIYIYTYDIHMHVYVYIYIYAHPYVDVCVHV